MSLLGITDDLIEVGTDLNLTCTISRIKPEASQMYWMMGDRREDGSLVSTNNSDGTLSQSDIFPYM